MEMEIHHDAWPGLRSKSLQPDPDQYAAEPLLDWQGLRARLIAAHALRREVSTESGRLQAAPASFDRSAAQELSALCDALQTVNRTALAHGKALAGNEANIDSAFKPGDRGLK